jgi:secondary thiamine-phosphate synthase enzyme
MPGHEEASSVTVSAAGPPDVDSVEVEVDTSHRRTVDVTDLAADFCRGRSDGLLNVFVPHATAGVALMETGSGSDGDLEDALERLLPRDDRYRHRHGSAGHGSDHLLPALVSPSVCLPVAGGRLLLGTWQSIVLVDLNGDNPRRQVRLSFIDG